MGTPAVQICENSIEDGHEGDAGTGSGALASAVSADKLGAFVLARDDHGANDFADEIGLDAVDLGRVSATVSDNGTHEWGPEGFGGRAVHTCEPTTEVTETGRLDYFWLADCCCKGLDG